MATRVGHNIAVITILSIMLWTGIIAAAWRIVDLFI